MNFQSIRYSFNCTYLNININFIHILGIFDFYLEFFFKIGFSKFHYWLCSYQLFICALLTTTIIGVIWMDFLYPISPRNLHKSMPLLFWAEYIIYIYTVASRRLFVSPDFKFVSLLTQMLFFYRWKFIGIKFIYFVAHRHSQ